MKTPHRLPIYLTLAIILSACSKPQPASLVAPAATRVAEAAEKPAEPPKPAGPTFKKPDHVRGVYMTAWSAGSNKKLDHMFEMFKRTGLNTMVIDLRDTGEMYVKTGIPLAEEVDPKHAYLAIVKPKEMMERLSKAGVYPVARIACFRDNILPKKHPEMAVQVANGKVWRDRSGHSWLDPYNKKNWDYVGATVDFALDLGFPEVQLDYVRFPSEGKSATQIFPSKKSYGDPKALPEDVIAAFANAMRDKAKKRGATISADIFGIISSTKGDEGIGQELEKVAAPFDLVSPMVYPSHFAKGEYGIKDPNAEPYLIVRKSLHDYQKRLPGKQIRPWLQDFSLGRKYSAEDVRAQIKAASEVGYNDFLLWNANNRYTEATFAKKLPESKPALRLASEVNKGK